MRFNIDFQVFATVQVDTETGKVVLVLDKDDIDTEFGLWDMVTEDADGNPFDAMENGGTLDQAELLIERACKAGTVILQVGGRR